MKADGLEDRAKLMKSVSAATEYAKRPVYLGKGWERKKVFRHDQAADLSKEEAPAARVLYNEVGAASAHDENLC
jgi:hypothetical protein